MTSREGIMRMCSFEYCYSSWMGEISLGIFVNCESEVSWPELSCVVFEPGLIDPECNALALGQRYINLA